MSFFKKIAKEFENLGIGDKDEKKQESQQGYPQGQDSTFLPQEHFLRACANSSTPRQPSLR